MTNVTEPINSKNVSGKSLRIQISEQAERLFQWYLLLFFRDESIQHQIRLHQSLTQQHLAVEDHRKHPAAEQERQISPREQIKNCQMHSCLIKYLLY